ncbi:MAG: inositol monophosphatase family protein [Candidatus Woesearchaeota archaeon]
MIHNALRTKTFRNSLEKEILKTILIAGKIIRKNAYNLDYVCLKGTDDPVTNLDRETELLIKKRLRNYDINFVGEEYGAVNNGSHITAYIDPIDGTKSFLRKEFLSTISVALADELDTTFGVVYDFMRGILFYANKESYMTIVGSKKKTKLPLNASYYSKTLSIEGNAPDISKKFEGSKYEIRTPVGSVALNMAQLAQGSYDGLIIQKIKGSTHDIAAGYHILKSAGFQIYNSKFGDFDYKNPKNGFIALSPQISDDVLKILGGN